MYRVILSVIMFVMMFSFSSCVKNDVTPTIVDKKQKAEDEANNKENVDMSDLDENLTETETAIKEGTNTVLKRVSFPYGEYRKLRRIGKGTIKGKIYLVDSYDQAVIGAGTRLYLNPITSYSKQWYEQSYISGHKLQKADPRLFNYLKFTAANAQGLFAFYGVASGNYYLIGTVKCAKACGYDTARNVRIATRVHIRGNEIVTKNLTKKVK